MWPFRRREARGRHALGAAVTGIPTTPMRPTPVPPVAETMPSRAVPDAVAVPVQAVPLPAPAPAPAEPDAVVVPVPLVPGPAPSAFMAPVATPLPSAPPTLPSLPAQPVDFEPALLELAGWGSTDQIPVQAAAPATVVATKPRVEEPAPVLPAPVQTVMVVDTPAVLSIPAVVQPPAVVPSPAPVGPRVELGFTDGTFRMLDPQSAAAQALSDLVGELTGNSERSSASAS